MAFCGRKITHLNFFLLYSVLRVCALDFPSYNGVQQLMGGRVVDDGWMECNEIEMNRDIVKHIFFLSLRFGSIYFNVYTMKY